MEEATMLASDLIETFNYDTLEDIILMFKYLRLGKLKNPKGDPLKINSRIDSDTLFNSIVPAYLDLKSLEREKQYQNHKYQNENIEIAEGSRDKFKELLQKLEQDKKLKTPEEITPVVNHAEYFKNIVEKIAPTLPINNLTKSI